MVKGQGVGQGDLVLALRSSLVYVMFSNHSPCPIILMELSMQEYSIAGKDDIVYILFDVRILW